ncbi:hypothetical protein AVEN_194639-1 [Araneus ventricosus]|uniref:Uncharacterized protein n=1 Tax=Araneus ventricosus TaxID=182803 RepID=A0A4Y2A6M7_ARAVE|nr:hypothetical protein AVEN_194639-1 [Araneus ventricosus]
MPGKPSENMVGRPVDEFKLEAFIKVCNFLDKKDYCQCLLSDLIDRPVSAGRAERAFTKAAALVNFLPQILKNYPSISKLQEIIQRILFASDLVAFSEISKYETSVTMNTSSEVQDNEFVQFVFDNADHNNRTVDGHGTFHVMGRVQFVTDSSAVQTSFCIPRPKITPTGKVFGKFEFILMLLTIGLRTLD